MTDLQELKERIKWMIQNQIELEHEHGQEYPWNKGYKEALEDILHYMEHKE